MRVPSRATSRPGRIVCPACGSGELRFGGAGLVGCDRCGRNLDEAVLRTIEQIVALPEAVGGRRKATMMEDTVGSAKGGKEALPAAQLTGESVLAKEEGAAYVVLTAPEALGLALVASLALVAFGSVLLILAII